MTKSKRSTLKPRATKLAQKRKTLAPRSKPTMRKQPVRATVVARQLAPAARSVTRLPTAAADARAPRPSKKAAITTLLHRPDGATLADLMAATGWLAHSVRAALTGLRRDGLAIARSQDAAGTTRYRIVGGA